MSVTRLKKFRTALEISQLTLAAQSGISLGTINKIERAISHTEMAGVGVGKLLLLARVLGVSAAELYPRLEHQPVSQHDRRQD